MRGNSINVGDKSDNLLLCKIKCTSCFPSSLLLETLTPVVRSPVDILFAKFWISIKGLQIILPKIRDAMNTTTVKDRSIMIMTVIIVWYFA